MVKAIKLSIGLAVVCFLVAFGCASTQAATIDQITLGPSSQDVTLIGAAGGTLDVTLGACSGTVNTVCTLSGTALLTDGTSSTYTLTEDYNGTGPSPIVAGPASAGIYPLNLGGATTWLSYGNQGPVQISYLSLVDGSPNPHFDGSWMVDGTPFNFDYTLTTISKDCNNGACTVDFVAANGGKIANGISAGEADAPEPASLGLFGLGLLGLAFVYRQRLKATA